MASNIQDLLDDVTVSNDYIMGHASANGWLDSVQYLKNTEGVNYDANGNIGIKMASKNGHASVVTELLTDVNVDPAIQNNYPLRMSSQNGNLAVVQILLADPGITTTDVQVLNNFAIKCAYKNSHTSTVDELKTYYTNNSLTIPDPVLNSTAIGVITW